MTDTSSSDTQADTLLKPVCVNCRLFQPFGPDQNWPIAGGPMRGVPTDYGRCGLKTYTGFKAFRHKLDSCWEYKPAE